MAVERVKEFREFELDVDTDAAAIFEFWTELPGQKMTQRFTLTFNTESTTTGRRPIHSRLPGGTKGALILCRITSSGAVRLFSARVMMRTMGLNSPWQWVDLPVEMTPPIFADAALPIEPTGVDYDRFQLPIPETPLVPIWVDVPVDPA